MALPSTQGHTKGRTSLLPLPKTRSLNFPHDLKIKALKRSKGQTFPWPVLVVPLPLVVGVLPTDPFLPPFFL